MATYPGGKAGDGVYQKIINLMPPHETYIEPFLGAGAILRAKRPASYSVGLDIDPESIDQFMKLDHPSAFIAVRDGIQYLRNLPFEHNKPSTLVYCDPPYRMITRTCKRPLYRHEMTDQQHEELLKIILNLKCMVMISGYWSATYEQMLAGWRTIQFQAQTRGRHTATEWVWMNFPPPLELHDYRYLGDNFRERERIKRRQNRWRARLERMDDQERYAMLSVLQDLRSASPDLSIPDPLAKFGEGTR